MVRVPDCRSGGWEFKSPRPRCGGCSSVGRASDCGSEGRGFKPLQPPLPQRWGKTRRSVAVRSITVTKRLKRDKWVTEGLIETGLNKEISEKIQVFLKNLFDLADI